MVQRYLNQHVFDVSKPERYHRFHKTVPSFKPIDLSDGQTYSFSWLAIYGCANHFDYHTGAGPNV